MQAFTDIFIEIVIGYAQKCFLKVISISLDSCWKLIRNIQLDLFDGVNTRLLSHLFQKQRLKKRETKTQKFQ